MPSLALKASVNYPFFIGGGSAPVVDSLLTGLLAFYPLHSNLLDASNFGNNSNYLGGDPNYPVDNLGNSPNFNTDGNNSLVLSYYGTNLAGAFPASSPIIDQTKSYTMTCWYQGLSYLSGFTSSGFNPPFIGSSSLIGAGSASFGPQIGSAFGAGGIYANNSAETIGTTYGIQQPIGGTNDLQTAFSTGFVFLVNTYNATNRAITITAYSTYGSASPYTQTGTLPTAPTAYGEVFAIGNDNQNYINGNNVDINRAGIWQRVLTNSEILRLWNNGNGIELNPNTNTWG
jgi:hypothetical protein